MWTLRQPWISFPDISEDASGRPTTRWGNNLGLRLPKSLITRLALSEGMQVQIEADDDRIILSLPQPRYQLSDLVANLTHDDLADAFDWGPNESREIVDWRGRS